MFRFKLAGSLFLTLLMTGCFQGKSRGTGTSSDVARGKAGTYFYVNLSTPPVGGSLTASGPVPMSGGITNCTETPASPEVGCGAPVTTTGRSGEAGGTTYQTQYAWGAGDVTITATPAAGQALISWAGDCSGNGPTCVLSPGADKTVVAIFGPPGGGHPNYTDPALHAPAFFGAVQACKKCHGDRLQGVSIAPGCAACHDGKLARLPPPGGFVQPSVGFAHPMPDWSSTPALGASHAAAYAADSMACRTCHGANLEGGSGYPACSQCHAIPPPPPVAVFIQPAQVTLDACQGRVFTAIVANTTNTAVTWTIAEAGGGTVTNGAYVAPRTAGTYHVTAVSQADPTKVAQATVTVGPEKVLSVAVVPGSGFIQPNGTVAFAATVTTTCGTFAAQ
jgi:hypothetical protein